MDRFLSKIGFSRGKLAIDLDKSDFALGEKVTGRISYQLKKPAVGEELWVELTATQRVTAPRVVRVREREGWRNEMRSTTSTVVLFQHKTRLDGHHYYDTGEYEFQLPLPSELPETPASEFSRAVEAVQSVFSGISVYRRPVRWRIQAKLVIPWSFGLTDRQTINVTAPSPKALPAEPRSVGKNFCTGCGRGRGPEDNFCAHCGRKF